MASPTQWTWVWASSRSWWTGKPCMLQSMESQRVRHDWTTELNSVTLHLRAWSPRKSSYLHSIWGNRGSIYTAFGSDCGLVDLLLSIGWQIKSHIGLLVQLVKNLPAVWDTWVRCLGWEDPLEKGKVTHVSILAWRIPWGCKESDMTERLLLSLDHERTLEANFENSVEKVHWRQEK